MATNRPLADMEISRPEEGSCTRKGYHLRTGAMKPPFFGILFKLLFAFTIPMVVLFAVFAWVAHEVERRDLEAELGTRLAAVAAASANQIRGEYLVGLKRPEDTASLEYQRYQPRLQQLAATTGAARLVVIDREFVTKVASDEIVPPGAEYVWARLDRDQIDRVYAGESVSSTLFEGQDGKQYMAGYAPVHETDAGSPIVLALGVEAAPAYFDRLAELRRSLLYWGAALAAFMFGVTVLVATLLTRPLRRLAAAAERIGRGDLEAPIDVRGRDEIGVLAATMERMRADLRARDQRLQMMLSGIAHEVRNPLGGMQLYTGILRDELAADDDKRAHVARIDKELAYLGAVVNDFLDYARRPEPQL
jgi:signal transduction histidine kinase